MFVSNHPLLSCHVRLLMRAHSRKRPALVTTTFSKFQGSRSRELRLYSIYFFLVFGCPVQKYPPFTLFTGMLKCIYDKLI